MIVKALHALIGFMALVVAYALIQGEMQSAFIAALFIFAGIGVIKAIERFSSPAT